MRAVIRRGPALATAAVLLASCAWGGASPTTGELQRAGSTVSLAVPALWASGNGSGQAGIEPAEVSVATNASEPGFTVDLTGIAAKGAGPQWQAATAAAAAAATLASGRDPSSLDLGFTITGAIDGPSAGGLLTVGLLAAMLETPLLPDVTMTGTISPDGSIGPIGYLVDKLKAAKDAGYTSVVIPASLATVRDSSGASVDLVAYGRDMGLTILPVQTVVEAYAAMTGTELYPPEQQSVTPSPSTEAAIRSTTRGLRVALQRAVDQAPEGTDPSTLGLATRGAAAMDASIAKGDWANAYGVGAFAFLQLARASGAARLQAQIDAVGSAAARAELRAAVVEALASAEQAMATALASPPNGLEQRLSLPAALGWIAYAIASYEGLLAELDLANDDASLLRAARILAEEQAGVEQMSPDALAVVRSMPSSPMTDEAAFDELMDGYSSFLIRAGDANLGYADAVMGAENVDGQVADDGVVAASRALAKRLASSSGSTNATRRAAEAITYYAYTNGLVSAHQAYGLSTGSGTSDAWTTSAQGAMDAAITTGSASAESVAARLRARGVHVGYPLWSVRWASAAAAAYRGTSAAAQAGWVALNEQWFDAVAFSMLGSGTAIVGASASATP